MFLFSTNVTKARWPWKHCNRPRLHTLYAAHLHSPLNWFRFPEWGHILVSTYVDLSLPSSPYTTYETHLPEKHIGPHSPEHRQLKVHSPPIPTNQTSPRKKFTHSAQRSRYFIKDHKYMTEQTELPPFESWELSVLGTRIRKSSQHLHVPRPTATGQVPLHFHQDWLASSMLRVTPEPPKVQHLQAHPRLQPCPPTSPSPSPASWYTSRRRRA